MEAGGRESRDDAALQVWQRFVEDTNGSYVIGQCEAPLLISKVSRYLTRCAFHVDSEVLLIYLVP